MLSIFFGQVMSNGPGLSRTCRVTCEALIGWTAAWRGAHGQSSLKLFGSYLYKTELAARISMPLADAEFRVAALTPHGQPVRRNCSLDPDARIALHPLHQQVER
jgi:hypothetical protein